MSSQKKMSLYSRRRVSLAGLFIIGCLIAAYGLVITIKTDTIHSKTNKLKEELKKQQVMNSKIAAKIKKRVNLVSIDKYATEKLEMGIPDAFQVIILESK